MISYGFFIRGQFPAAGAGGEGYLGRGAGYQYTPPTARPMLRMNPPAGAPLGATTTTPGTWADGAWADGAGATGAWATGAWATGLDDETRAWLPSCGPAEFALALSLGARCLRAIPELGAHAAPAASAARGAAGESEIYELLHRAHGSRLRDVSRRAHSGDLVCYSRAGPVLIEVKHYSNTVPGAEVDKFLRDLQTRDAAAGVILSLTSPLIGQRAPLSVALEARVETGTLVPVVYAAAGRDGGRLHPDIALAAVEIAICLAEVYPRGVRGLHGRDTSLAYAAAAGQLADGAASVRTELAQLAASVAGSISGLGERAALLGRSARDLARGIRAEAEEVRETAGDAGCEALAVDLRSRYSVRAAHETLVRAILNIEASAGVLAGAVGEENRWRLLKDRATHVHSGCGFAFLKGATEVRIPAARLPAETVAQLLKTHAKKVKLANAEVSLELDDSTLEDALAAIGAA
jgi:hypothetical protein